MPEEIKQLPTFRQWLDENFSIEFCLRYVGDLKGNPIFKVSCPICNNDAEAEIIIFDDKITLRETK